MRYAIFTIVLLTAAPYFLSAQEKINHNWAGEATTSWMKFDWADLQSKNGNGGFQLPQSAFRMGYGLGIRKIFAHSQSLYYSINANWYQNRSAVKSLGPVVVFINNQWTALQVEYIEYKFHQFQLQPQLGFVLTKCLAAEGGIYVANAFNTLDYKIGDFIDWTTSENFQMTWDYGLAGGLVYSLDRFYLRCNYQMGIKKQEELSVTDANGQSLGKIAHRNHQLTAALGYYF